MKKILIAASLISSFFITGCNLFGGSPPYEFESWKKNGVSVQETKQVMGTCGYLDPRGFGRTYVSDNGIALAQTCMLKKGFSYEEASSLFCNQQKLFGVLPACIEYKRGSPLSAEELEKIETELYYFSYGWTSWRSLGWWKVGVEKTEEVWVDLNGKRVESEEIINRNKAKVKLVTDQMIACGYPKIKLNDAPEKKTVSYAELGRMERCMEKAGYEYEYPNLRVCKMYPQIRGCE